jgi:hypothetical protein
MRTVKKNAIKDTGPKMKTNQAITRVETQPNTLTASSQVRQVRQVRPASRPSSPAIQSDPQIEINPFMSLDKGCKKPLPGHPSHRITKSTPRNPGAIILDKRQDGDDQPLKYLWAEPRRSSPTFKIRMGGAQAAQTDKTVYKTV